MTKKITINKNESFFENLKQTLSSERFVLPWPCTGTRELIEIHQNFLRGKLDLSFSSRTSVDPSNTILIRFWKMDPDKKWKKSKTEFKSDYSKRLLLIEKIHTNVYKSATLSWWCMRLSWDFIAGLIKSIWIKIHLTQCWKLCSHHDIHTFTSQSFCTKFYNIQMNFFWLQFSIKELWMTTYMCKLLWGWFLHVEN